MFHVEREEATLHAGTAVVDSEPPERAVVIELCDRGRPATLLVSFEVSAEYPCLSI